MFPLIINWSGLRHLDWISTILNVTEFVKRGLIHASNFSTLRTCNFEGSATWL